jgi:DNA-binding MarR family transcriptional regulator
MTDKDAHPFEPGDAETADRVLRSLRRVSRAIDQHSRRLAKDHHLTGPQLVCLRQLRAAVEMTPSRLAQEVSLSHATVTGILNRLEKQGLVTRTRDDRDRRRSLVRLTDKGLSLVGAAPFPLQERFLRELDALPSANRSIIATVLEQVVDMMAAESLDAAPLLTTGEILSTPEAVEEVLEE